MNRDSSVADNSSKAAEMESVCQAFRDALLAGKVPLTGNSTFDFEDYLARVEPHQRLWLAHSLTKMQENHLASTGETSDLLSTNFDFAVDAVEPTERANVESSSNSPADAAYRVVFNCATLSRLPENAKSALAACIERREFKFGDHLLHQGQPAAGLHILCSGRVEVLDIGGGKSKRIDYDGPGSVLGEMSLLTGQVCSADVIALQPTVALVLPVDGFEKLRQEFPELEIA